MEKILIYGDSNVWGDNFSTGTRIPDEAQWPNILQKKLGKEYKIIQEGLPGRIAGNDEINKKYKNGLDTFLSTFRTNAPINQIIIMLGTNDLQIKYQKKSKQIFNDLLEYSKIIEQQFIDIDDQKKYFINNKIPKITYILPINFDYQKNAKEIFDEESEKRRLEVINQFQNSKLNYIIVDQISLFNDGIHLDFEGHQKLANIVKEYLL